MTAQAAPSLGGILAVVVVYKIQPVDSPSLASLLASAALLAETPQPPRLRILIADNTPGGQHPRDLPATVEYAAYPDNPGLARPYNDALKAACQDGFEWLLTLDQDTSLPPSFLVEMAKFAGEYATSDEVAAVVPRIVDGDRIISPFRFAGGFWPSVLPAGTSGFAGTHASALNSGSLLRVRSLRELGGYDEAFPLHNSDTRLYQRLDETGKRVLVAGHIIVPHELSIMDREHRMSPERYRQMLLDEATFWDRHMSAAGRAERLIRLIGRYTRGLFKGEAAAFQRVTRDEIIRRLVTSRRKRLRVSTEWK